MDPKKKFFLFKQSKNFCSVPWNLVKINTDGSVFTCAVGKDLVGHLNADKFEDILQGLKLQEIRNTLGEDQQHTNCRNCVDKERPDEGFGHLRNHYNSLFLKKDIDYTSTSEFNLNAIDLHWSSVCNLKCITCCPEQSSSIAKEERKPVWHTSTEAADTVIDKLVDNQYELNEIYMSGGEPSLINHNLRLLKRLDKNIDTSFRVNSNMMFDDNNEFIKELLKFKNVMFTISVDGMGDRFNYIRRGADWNTLLKNVSRMRETHADCRINSVFFVGTASSIIDIHAFFRNEFGIDDFTINQESMDHPEIWARNLPDRVKESITKDMEDYMKSNDGNINLKGQLLNCLEEIKQPQERSYVEFFDAVDAKAGTNWREVFPEL